MAGSLRQRQYIAGVSQNLPSWVSVFNGSLWSVESNNQMDLAGSVFEYNVLMATALTCTAKLVGNLTSGDEARSFAVGSSLSGAP